MIFDIYYKICAIKNKIANIYLAIDKKDETVSGGMGKKKIKTKDAMIHQHHTFKFRPIDPSRQLDHLFCKNEARHHVRHNQHAVTIK